MVKYMKYVLFTLILLGMAAAPAWSLDVGDPSPGFALETLEGKPVALADFKDKSPVMMVFWATWCPICKEELPQIKKIAADFGPQGLAVLGINVGVNDSPRKAKVYHERYELNYPVAFDHGSEVSRAFGVAGTPTVVILDKRGIVRYRAAAVPQDLGEHFASLKE